VLFHTWIFAAFFAIVWPAYLALKRTRFGTPWLLAASYVFYAWWNPLYLLLIVYSTLIDYLAVVGMARTGRRKAFLAGSIVNNLALLGLFKYAPFVTDNLNALLASLGWPYALPAPTWLLPVGISFYTFQSMSYTIDCYRGRIDAEPSLIRFAAFVALFPQLVAGPIERAGHLLPQLRRPRRLSGRDVADGLSLLLVGLFKKLALADYLAMYVDRVYDVPEAHTGAALAVATVAFGWQIYFDFSGYTDMARGIGRLLGFRLTDNFNHPYLATGLGDFWRRWHVSLSTWFRDYLYIPLGGGRRGRLVTVRNVAVTFLVAGLWHGAAWTFVIWGALHAAGLCLTRRLERSAFYRDKVPGLLKRAWVFAFVTFAWVFFRAPSVSEAWGIVKRIATAGWADPGFPLMAAGMVLAVWAHQAVRESRAGWVLRLAPVRVGLAVAMILYLAGVTGGDAQPFIYFQF